MRAYVVQLYQEQGIWLVEVPEFDLVEPVLDMHCCDPIEQARAMITETIGHRHFHIDILTPRSDLEFLRMKRPQRALALCHAA